MQTKPFNLTIYTIGAALAATFLALTAPTALAGWFNVPSEPADWNGPFVSFDVAGGVWSNFDISGYHDQVDLIRQFNQVPPSSLAAPNDATGGFFPVFLAPSHSSDDSAYLAGVDLGYNKQWGHFVAGFSFGFTGTKVTDQSEARDLQENFITVNATNPPLPAGIVPPGGEPVAAVTDFHSVRRVEQLWAGYVGGQIGYTWNRFLIYALGGCAFAQIDVKSLDRAATEFFDDGAGIPGVPAGADLGHTTPPSKKILDNNVAQVGWFVGGGLQYALTDAVTAGLEYRHNDYGNTDYHLNGGGPVGIFPGGTSVSVDNNQVLFKVTVLLGHLGEKHAVEPGLSKK